jgi:hypothetical protein
VRAVRRQTLVIHDIMNLVGVDGYQLITGCNIEFCGNAARVNGIYT